jgi:hypothetical protein
MDSNRAERAIKSVALGRKAWLFYGSDDHPKERGGALRFTRSLSVASTQTPAKAEPSR